MNIVVNLRKGYGITSHDATTAVKKIFKVKKAGHAGTLDPTATGLLLVCLNEATKITGYLSDLDKEYIATAKLGECTDTYDSEGRVIKSVTDFDINRGDIEGVISKFIGEIEQIPPMYSAIKVAGRPLYKLVRRGIEVERRPRKIVINEIEVLRFEYPFFTMRVSCSKGTYIRSLCNDIGDAIGVGSYMTELSRTKIGDFCIEDAAKIDELPHKSRALHSIDSALRHLPEVRLMDNNLRAAKSGNPIRDYGSWVINYRTTIPLQSPTQFVKLKDGEGRLFGIGRVVNDLIKIKRLFVVP
ncbi:tRNA pseudouridine(55) synthase TruB [Thermodesulfovibrionales bacterium]|nr:tRNA pseudouridine(55) synthase TruB [Thermodesulfovibrionales bacterium]